MLLLVPTHYGSIAVIESPDAAAFLAETAKDTRFGLGRVVPKAELARHAPQYASASAVYESAPGFLFSSVANGEIFSKPHEIGNHWNWPTRYRSVYVLWGNGIQAQRPDISSRCSKRKRILLMTTTLRAPTIRAFTRRSCSARITGCVSLPTIVEQPVLPELNAQPKAGIA